MFTKKELRVLVMGSMASFFLIALTVYMYYMNFKPRVAQTEPLRTEHQDQAEEEENRVVMAYDVDKIKPDTNVVFEIVDQQGVVTQTNMYPGVNWIDVNKIEMSEMYPDYVIKNFKPDQVLLTRVMERQIEPDYVLTIQDDKIIIAIVEDGKKVFHKDTGLEQHDFSVKLGKALKKGIVITPEQKETILEDDDELYIIFQEYDE